MFSIWTLVAITLVYLLFMFAVATYGNRVKRLPASAYSLALGIHCTSWAFFGTTTQAAQFGWPLVPTYLGVMLVMFFGFRVLLIVSDICKQYNISSIAEFISIRFGHANSLGFVVTLICFIGVIPYIALQLDAITLALNLLLDNRDYWSGSISLYVTLSMAVFAIWFGARKMSLTERNSGLVLTIATQSAIKLIALLIVGSYVVYGVFDGLLDITEKSLNTPSTREVIDSPFAYWVYLSHMLLGICSMFCLPRQFHINFVENKNHHELKQARWLFPLYLVLMSAFVLPIAFGGMIYFSPSGTTNLINDYSADSYVLAFPIATNQTTVAIIAFIGGLAASSSMVIVATLALGNMVANSFITPLLFKLDLVKSAPKETPGQVRLTGNQVLRIRQLTILVMLIIAYAYHVNVSQQTPLAETGTIAISLLAQTFPAILLGIYWYKASSLGALLGIVAGVLTIVIGMFLPVLEISDNALSPNQIANVLFLSLILNTSFIVLTSIFQRKKMNNPYAFKKLATVNSEIKFADLLKLTNKILPPKTAQAFHDQIIFLDISMHDFAPSKVTSRAEQLLSAHMGSASTQILMQAIANKKNTDQGVISELVEEASKSFQFNKEVLQASITHLPLGISVIDANMKLVAWNRLYEQLFDYPSNYLVIGKPIMEILQFNGARGLFGDNKTSQEIEDEINKRMQSMLMGATYKTVRPQINQQVVEISGHPLPAGGYITCYSDISEYISIQNQLENAKKDLEKRVEKRTYQLQQAKNEAEEANVSKTKFLAATSHDLMQPLNAASLFASMLQEKLKDKKEIELAENLVSSLENAESLLNMLVDITKLENNLIKPNIQQFELDKLLRQITNEFSILAQEKGLELKYEPCSLWVETDRRLLRRVLQNLLSNALRYTQEGKILVGVKRNKKDSCRIIVADTGSGIAEENQAKIFREFKRLNPSDTHQGLGLGLTIVDKISQLLNYNISLISNLGKGSLFTLHVKTTDKKSTDIEQKPIRRDTMSSNFLKERKILLIENDDAVAKALTALLTSWGGNVYHATDQATALKVRTVFENQPDIIVADYHLDNLDNGVDTSLAVQAAYGSKIVTVVSSADRSEDLQALAYENQMQYLPKPIKQAALKRLIQRLMKAG